MSILSLLKKTFLTPTDPQSADFAADMEAFGIKYKVMVVEFSETIDSASGEILAALLHAMPQLDVSYFNEPFNKNFLSLDGRTFFDFIDKGQAIIDKTGTDVLIWGYRENDKIRLNFQTATQYEQTNTSFLTLLDSLYLPCSIFDNANNFPPSILNLIIGAIITAAPISDKQRAIQQKYLLKRIIDQLSHNDSAKIMPLEYLPYIMNFLSVIYMTYCRNSSQEKDFKVVNRLLNTAISHQDLIKNPMHLGCIYNHFGQLHTLASATNTDHAAKHYRAAIANYQLAQKYIGKYVYPYNYGFISYELSNLLYDYWKQNSDIQALRDAVFNLREAEKIFTYAVFPEFWAEIEGMLGQRMSVLSSTVHNNAIAELAIAAYKNQQKIITEKRDPYQWATIQENIGNIYYRMGRELQDSDLLEESLEYFHDALYIFENMDLSDNTKRVTTYIARTSDLLE
ncbi:MAG: hypothetical protein IJ529_04705 [Alphaproteobacteria bacterium]|nr:hypothetical protein [Alphaproteobacteria bacterium]MBQ9236177.1 hypothetical protein [Alphaproteobacteria bacterium]